ncbi:MAG: CDP-alcohol phosphatidyltransferase family protein [Gemmatimonadaceae bacterium]|nr:CDP-alcohol phosphatidyltransferase family protein [Gemmatimonadaceae bacterium]
MRRLPMLTLPNLLSASRFPLAAAFLAVEQTPVRVALIGAASLTDVLDGWLARRQQTTRLGALLDPIADKTFVLVAISAFLVAGELSTLDYFVILLRDFATAIGFLVAYLLSGLDPKNFKARKSGKVVTILQLATVLALVLHWSLLRPLIWLVGAASVWAIVDYTLLLKRQRAKA